MLVKKHNKSTTSFSHSKLKDTLARLSINLNIDQDLLLKEISRNIYDGIATNEIDQAIIMAATSFIELEPDFNYLAARAFLQKLKKEVFGKSTKIGSTESETEYRSSFVRGIQTGVKNDILSQKLLSFDLEALSQELVLERDLLFKYLGLQTLYERYFLRGLEMPQSFWMRVAMGLSINEPEKVLEFYHILSQMYYVPSTPTLLNSGFVNPQLSSCYLTTIDDDLKYIFKSYGDNAELAKWSGGIGNDWTNVRGTGAFVRKTKIESQGVIPFLKIANDGTVAINRSGKRRGATCAYLEVWHYDVEDFIDLRRNTGDERRRTHDMNTALWVPNLFMKRVKERGEWTLFSPDEVPDLHSSYGQKFEDLYEKYEKSELKKKKTVSAWKLWKKIITSLYETGHPWITWKDPSNLRNPQDHVGVINSSNLCTEILLNTSATKYIRYPYIVRKRGEVAVCNIGSLNLKKFVINGKINWTLLAKIIQVVIRILDNVIDLNYYPIEEARYANLKHRPVGLGQMGFQDALYELGINFEDSAELVDELQEFISYQAILASANLAKERGVYSTFKGSKWDRGLFPLDTFNKGDKKSRLDWGWLKGYVKEHGMRNSHTMAIAPTATIANVAGCFPSFEGPFKNLYVKANISGEFTIVNEYLIKDLKKLGLWNKDMLDLLKYYDGSVQSIDEIPEEIRVKYKEAFEVDVKKAIDLTALRSKWIDMSQSHNIFYSGDSGDELSEIYFYAWEAGLKTTYYLRTRGASGSEKSTLSAKKFGFTQKRDQGKMCLLDDPNCEACQ